MKVNLNFVYGAFMTSVICLVLVAVGQSLVWSQILLVFLASYPWTFEEDVYSLWGGISEEGSVYSLFGIIQVAKKDALSLLGISFIQKAGEDATQLFGISFWQEAGEGAWQVAGISFVQKAEKKTEQMIGISFVQKAGEDTIKHFFSIALLTLRAGTET